MVVKLFTFHRCASSFMGRFCDHNPAWEMYQGKTPSMEFTEGVYGPFRLSEREDSPIRPLIEKAINTPTDVGIFIVRMPEDILKSEYKSFGWTHELSPVEEIAKIQQANREKIQTMTEEEYIEENLERIYKAIELMPQIKVKERVAVTYEQLKHDFPSFKERLQPYFNKEIINEAGL